MTKSAIVDLAIMLFERLGYDYIHAPDIAPDGDRPERSRRLGLYNHADVAG